MAPKKQKKAPSGDELVKFVEGLKRQWMATIDALIDPLMIVSRTYKIVKANRAMAEMAGKTVKSIVGTTCYEVFAQRKSPCEGCSMRTAARQCNNVRSNLSEIRDGRLFEVYSQPFLDTQGRVEGVVQVYRDRTDAIRMQEKLMQTEKLASIGLLAGGVAHEINNPLGGIMVFSQMLLRELKPDDPHYADVKEIENAAQRCKVIVENLLEFARGMPATVKKADLRTDIVQTLHSALRFAKISLHWRHIDIDDQSRVGEYFCAIDHNQLMQVFLNLLQNAGQAMPEGGTIVLRSGLTKRDGRSLIFVEVEDAGTGMSAETMKHIFDPFFTTKEPGEGTGLGLAICFGIIQEAGGRIEVKSKIDVGSTFRVEVPVAADIATKKVS